MTDNIYSKVHIRGAVSLLNIICPSSRKTLDTNPKVKITKYVWHYYWRDNQLEDSQTIRNITITNIIINKNAI